MKPFVLKNRGATRVGGLLTNPFWLLFSLLAGGRICRKDGRMLFTGLTNDEMAKIIPLRRSDLQHLQSCQR